MCSPPRSPAGSDPSSATDACHAAAVVAVVEASALVRVAASVPWVVIVVVTIALAAGFALAAIVAASHPDLDLFLSVLPEGQRTRPP